MFRGCAPRWRRAGEVEYRAVVVATLTLAHQPEAVEALERRLRDEILTANLSRGAVISADERFTIQRVLGHGASSVVCRALETKLQRPIALKLFPGLANDALAGAVKREALALARVSHANIVTVHDYGVLKLLPGEHCCFFVAMELGVPLKDWLRETSPPPERVVATFYQIGEGLAAIHAAGLVYRDFKPENVVLVAGVPKIVDFGLALSAVAGSGMEGARIVGTPAFMSPEALLGRPQDPRSDQFSFAAALWKALCGELPYDGLSHDPAMRGPLRPPRATMPEAVLPVLRRALDPEPERRFPDMAALLAALAPRPEPARSASATARVPAVMLDVDSTTEFMPVRPPARRSLAPWLAFPAVGVLSVGGVLMAMGFWDEHEAAAVDEEVPVPGVEVPPQPSPVPACPPVGGLTGEWHFATTARWAERNDLLGTTGRYVLVLTSDGTPCGLQADLRKDGTSKDPKPRSDRQRVELVAMPPFIGGFRGRFAPRRAGDTAVDYSYEFAFVVDQDRLYGDFHAEASAGKHRFSGTLQGERAGTPKAPKDGHVPCSVACGARCLGADATAQCRQACAADAWAGARCPAPAASERITVPPRSKFRAEDGPYVGRWLFVARDRKTGVDRAYELELGVEGGALAVKAARERDSDVVLRDGTTLVYDSGRWEISLMSGREPRVRHEWSLVGRDPAFGEFAAKRGDTRVAAGVIAAYRLP